MVEVTHGFLQEISQMLRKQYAPDISGNYLFKMVDHLETFYEDVKDELKEKELKIQDEIEGKGFCRELWSYSRTFIKLK